jgi:hypothetical protein
MFVVVPGEELLTESTGIWEAAETIGKIRAVLEGAELTLRVWIVIGNVGPAVSLGDAQVGHQEGDGLGEHDPAAVGVDVELTRRHIVFGARLLR